MNWDAATFTARLRETVRSFDRQGAAALCAELIAQLLRRSEPYPSDQAEAALQTLRSQRLFDLMQTVGDALIQTGNASPRIRRQFAQSLLDQGNLTAAMSVLRPLCEDSALDATENAEAWGLMGRAYKQLYVNSGQAGFARNRQALERAVTAYWRIYELYRRNHLWHGINVVALLCRARRDDVPLKYFPTPESLAKEILGTIQEKEQRLEASVWDYATAVEACVALRTPGEAVAFLKTYLERAQPEAFELASMLRQFTELWRLDLDETLGPLLLPALRSALLARQGGAVELVPAQVKAEAKQGATDGARLEKVFGADSFKTYQWYLKGVDRCRAIARIGLDSARGLGTGFAMKGSDLHPQLGEQPVILTNAHVVSPEPTVDGALRPEDAVVIFEATGPQEFRVQELIWTSPPHELDATLLRLEPAVSAPPSYPVAKNLPLKDGQQRVYVIGHPGGGTLSLSLQDNVLLDYDQRLLHYRAPTEGGSSGSPVFNGQWELIALHHAGGMNVAKLHGQPGTYPANEGVWIQPIIQALQKRFAGAGP
jgi:S1-C subfamily serine protease